MSNWRRLVGLVRFGVRRTAAHASVSRQVVFAVVGVAFTVMLMTTVGGIALGLASNSAVQSEDVDYWVVPEESTAEALAVDVGGPSLGDVHAVTDRLSTDRRIDYVTPIALRIVRLSNTETGTREYVLAVGVIPARDQSVAGLSMSALTPGDPYYANGSFDGRWTGELVTSDAAAQLLDADTGTVLRSDGTTNASFLVVDRQQAGLSTGAGPVPVVVVHLAELQALSGGTASDQAEQLLVRTDDPSVRSDIERLYPETDVVARGDLSARQLSTSNLPLAVAVTAFLTAFTVGVLLVATTMGLAVTDDRAFVATLAALGFSGSSRSLLVLVEVLTVALLGGGLGTVLGLVGIVLTNAATRHLLGVGVAVVDGRLLAVGLAVSVLIGLVASAYPLWLTRRTRIIEVLNA